jgi:transcriptional regulator with XRE-family HTH domain
MSSIVDVNTNLVDFPCLPTMPTMKVGDCMANRQIKQTEIVRFFADRLRSIRQSRGMTQRELANRANITLSYISKLEAAGAAPGIDLVERLANALETDVAALLPSIQQASASQAELKRLFDATVKNAGNETLVMLHSFLVRLADSPSSKR